MNKWDFQQPAINRLLDHLEGLKADPDRKSRCVFQLPTGAGKTRCASEILKIKSEQITGNEKLLFVADQINLVEQTFESFTEQGLYCGIIQGQTKTNLMAPIQVASIQTIPNRGEMLDAHGITFPFQIYDEAHCLFDSAKEVMGDNEVVGLTATPLAKGMDQFYDPEIVVGATYRELLDRGVLVNLTGWKPEKDFDPSELVEVQSGYHSGEYTNESASVEYKKQIAQEVIPFWLAKGMNAHKTLVFVPSIADAEVLASDFNQAGYSAYAYHSKDIHHEGKTKKDARDKAALDSFKAWGGSDGVQIMVTVDRFIKGVDVPDVICCILARPIKTQMKLWQAVGRAMRSAPGKIFGYLLDMCGNMDRVGWPTEMDFRVPKLRAGRRQKSEYESQQRWLMQVKDHEPKVTEIIARRTEEVEETRFTNRHRKLIKFEGLGEELKGFCERNGLAYKEEKHHTPKACIECEALMSPGDRVCVACGYEHDFKPEKSFVSADAAMVDIELPEMSKEEKKAMRTYQGLKGFAEARKWKSSWADLAYKEHFGNWPPYGWKGLGAKKPTKQAKEIAAAKAKEWRRLKKERSAA